MGSNSDEGVRGFHGESGWFCITYSMKKSCAEYTKHRKNEICEAVQQTKF